MKYLLFSITAMMMIFFVQQLDAKTTEDNTKEINDMVAMIEEQDLNLANLETTIRERRTIQEISRFIDNLEGYQLTMVDDDTYKLDSNRRNNSGVNESLLIVRTYEKKNEYQVLYTISTTKMTPEVLEKFQENIKGVTKSLFTDKAQYFSCAQAWKNGIIDIVSFINFVKSELKMSIIDEVNEPDFTTWTGYTAKWKQEIQQYDQEFNIQIAVREGIGDRSTVTIGTPILINEY
ncbi:YwmB family TATA-box binding protein [Gracilibacillus caseinilyticus]|uniref:YwmB family TATA-box binding protein n=1 Tax=Gracilibacillus caseinilyticus TaxID=2932256 RepID=A0ABY4F0R8_9BACI|nr:YwmB family TATA-box binding protein [Gracilibacillus caseinilyticus]UOQ50259.1 YwmB family TATA-box binding protein [Gracilibacillus caseinilyticus]